MGLHTPKQLDIEDLPDTVSPAQWTLAAMSLGPPADLRLSDSVPDATGYSNPDAEDDSDH
jgi:hypothetical protein